MVFLESRRLLIEFQVQSLTDPRLENLALIYREWEEYQNDIWFSLKIAFTI